MSVTNSPRIAIIGAGPGGLTCARVLQQHGLRPRVFDVDASVDARDAGGSLDLHADTGQLALEDAGLLTEFLRRASISRQAKVRRDSRGTVLGTFVPDTDDTAAPEIDRGELRRMLAEHVLPDSLQWGHRLTGAERVDDVWRLRFDLPRGDGADEGDTVTVDADVVIGADGAWSRVRPLLTDAVPEHLGVAFLDVRYDDVEERHPEIAELVGDGELFARDDGGRGIILQRNANGVVRGYLAFRAAADWHVRAGVDVDDREAVTAHLLGEFADWAPQYRHVFTALDGSYVPRAFTALPAPLTWRRVPGVTLIGDAAHLMGPFGGFGANLAMLDAAELATALTGTDDVEGALTRYERAMFARSGPLATGANGATRDFFAEHDASSPHTAPDTTESHRAYEARAAEHRRSRGAA